MLNQVHTIPLPGEPSAADLAVRIGTRKGALREFIAGPENRLACVAVEEFLGKEKAGGGKCEESNIVVPKSQIPNPKSASPTHLSSCSLQPSYNPLFLYGPAGTGKTHLAAGIANEWCRRHGREALAIYSGREFARSFGMAVRTHSLESFRRQCRERSLLVVDGIDGFGTKPSTQRELSIAIDAVLERAGRVVATALVAPGDLAGVSAALRGRLLGGLVVPLARPRLAARLQIVERLADARGLSLSSAAVRRLAEGLDRSARELAEAVATLDTLTRRLARTLDGRDIDHFLAQRRRERVPALRTIADRTALHFELKTTELKSPCRERPVVRARSIAMFLARELTPLSLNRIGRYFGGRDHATVLHACRRVKELQSSDPETSRSVEQVREALIR